MNINITVIMLIMYLCRICLYELFYTGTILIMDYSSLIRMVVWFSYNFFSLIRIKGRVKFYAL